MNVFEQYDNQLARYLDQSNPMILPLQSWDVYMENIYSLSRLYSDINEINKMTAKLIVDVDIVSELKKNHKTIIITDADLKIEFASANMLNMSGYLPSEIRGKSPKMFQGPATKKEVSNHMRVRINEQKPFEATITNYKKNKTLYSCHIKGYPVFNKKGDLVKYVAVEQAA